MNLKRVGYYKEMPHGDETDVSIKDFINIKQDKDKIAKICQYLDNGILIDVCPGYVDDIIYPEKGVAGSPNDCTDGTWIWPGDLSYYVANYMLKLPDDFVSTMIENQWKIPITSESIDIDNLEIEGKRLFD